MSVGLFRDGGSGTFGNSRPGELQGTESWGPGGQGMEANVGQSGTISQGRTDPGMRGASRGVGSHGWNRYVWSTEGQGERETGEGMGSFSKEVPREVVSGAYSLRVLWGDSVDHAAELTTQVEGMWEGYHLLGLHPDFISEDLLAQ